MKHDDLIISHTYTTGGDYGECITISYKYLNNIPVSVFLPHLLYEPECSIGSDLERGNGTELLIKTALRYAYKEVPEINIFKFDDMSHIDCIAKDLSVSPPRKPSKKISLYYFSIVYHGMTWYEARFNAKMIDDKKYTSYKRSLDFLTDPKEKLPFERFLELAQPNLEQIATIKPIYAMTNTYRQMFEGIPEAIRCNTLYLWLPSFMKHYIEHTFSEKDWIIDVNDMEPRKPSRQRGGTRKHNSKSKVLYRIYNFKETHDF